jgi:hypothetical protein
MFQLRMQLAKAYAALKKLNLFRSTQQPEGDDNGYQLKNQLISTRLFIFLLSISMIILLIYTSQVQVTHTITIDSPSLEVYSSLYEKYGEILTCPCTNIAIAQQEFISLTPTFHQICASDFVKSSWLSYLNAATHYLISSDFQDTGSLLFQILTSFCQLAQDTIKDSLPKFYSTSFVSYDVIDMELLNNQSQSLIELYILTTANQFSYSFDFIRDAISGNGFLSGILTNFNLGFTYDSSQGGYRIVPKYKTYNEPYMCDCSITSSCVSPAAIHDNVTGNIIFVIPGLFTGCLLVEAMRQSNLQCLYNQTCLNQIKNYTRPSIPSSAKALDISIRSRYNVSTNISEILANLMVETWIENISYSGYYNQCQPVQCTYTTVGKNSVIYIVTALFGLCGGLCKALYFLIPNIVKIIRRRRGKAYTVKILSH